MEPFCDSDPADLATAASGTINYLDLGFDGWFERWNLRPLPMGTTTLICMATDYAGNVATASFDITVVESTGDTTGTRQNSEKSVVRWYIIITVVFKFVFTYKFSK